MIDVVYSVDHLDQRDGGKHAVFVDWIDSELGLTSRKFLATFEPDAGEVAKAFVKWANRNREASPRVIPAKPEAPRSGVS